MSTKMNRYRVMAKRRGTAEEFTDWTIVENYSRAVHHLQKVEDAGFEGSIEVHPEVIKVWDILNETDLHPNDIIRLTDEIFDTGLQNAARIRRQTKSRTARAIFREIRKEFKPYEPYREVNELIDLFYTFIENVEKKHSKGEISIDEEETVLHSGKGE